MENNKLQELTQKLYNDGLEKGRTDADRLVAEAKEAAAKILADAKAEAEAIAKAAEARAEDIAKNAMTEITLAGRQAVSKIKAELTEAVRSTNSTSWSFRPTSHVSESISTTAFTRPNAKSSMRSSMKPKQLTNAASPSCSALSPWKIRKSSAAC